MGLKPEGSKSPLCTHRRLCPASLGPQAPPCVPPRRQASRSGTVPEPTCHHISLPDVQSTCMLRLGRVPTPRRPVHDSPSPRFPAAGAVGPGASPNITMRRNHAVQRKAHSVLLHLVLVSFMDVPHLPTMPFPRPRLAPAGQHPSSTPHTHPVSAVTVWWPGGPRRPATALRHSPRDTACTVSFVLIWGLFVCLSEFLVLFEVFGF